MRYVWAERNDFTPTPEQVKRGLADCDAGEVYEAWLLKARQLASDSLYDDNSEEYYTI